MGFSVRKRTKGKGSWLNLSYSKKGLHASHSMKFGELTINMGRKIRSTINFGNGMRYIKTHSSKPTKKDSSRDAAYISTSHNHSESNTSYSSYPEQKWSSENIAMMSGMFWCLFGLVFAYIISSVLITIAVIQIAHVLTLRWKLTKYPQQFFCYFIPLILIITPIGWIYIIIMFFLV